MGGCLGGKIVEELKGELEVTRPSARGLILERRPDSPAYRCNAAGTGIDLVFSLADLEQGQVYNRTTGYPLFRLASYWDPFAMLAFFSLDGKIVALKGEQHFAKHGDFGYWNFYVARPAAAGQKPARTVAGEALYFWGMFKYSRAHNPEMVQYAEVSDQRLAVEEPTPLRVRDVSLDGKALLTMKYNACRPSAVYGPGSHRGQKLADQMLCGKPVAVVERFTGPAKLTMAIDADPILLFGMTHCCDSISAMDTVIATPW